MLWPGQRIPASAVISYAKSRVRALRNFAAASSALRKRIIPSDPATLAGRFIQLPQLAGSCGHVSLSLTPPRPRISTPTPPILFRVDLLEPDTAGSPGCGLLTSCFFFAGVGGVMSAVYTDTTTRHRQLHLHATSRKAMRVLLAQLGSVVSAAFSTTTALGVLGLAAASTATTVAVCVPPPALYENAYFLAISCFFFAGVAGIMSAACMATTHLRDRDTTSWKKVMHVNLAQLVSVVGAAFSTKTALGLLGLAAASTAMNLQSLCQPHQPPRALDESECYYHLAIAGVFFAGVAGVMAAVREGGQVAKWHPRPWDHGLLS